MLGGGGGGPRNLIWFVLVSEKPNIQHQSQTTKVETFAFIYPQGERFYS